jgi:2-keto-3-deoxy-L-rhamnonate aldolase RhmA
MLGDTSQGRCGLMAAIVSAALTTMVASPAVFGQVNTDFPNPATWVYGPLFSPPAGGSPIWNPAKVRMNLGLLTNGGTIGSFSTETAYCNIANRTGEGSSDFTWTEVQHNAMDWNQVWTMWMYPCALNLTRERGITPGARLPYTNIREVEKALDGGAMTIVLPTMDSAEEARNLVQMVYYPPIGKRKYGPGQWQTLYANVPGGYRQTFNDNVVVWVMVETLEGSRAAYQIAQVPGIHGVFGATSDLGNFSGFVNGQNDYDYLITNTHNAAHFAGKRACTSFAQRNRPGHTFTCTQN